LSRTLREIELSDASRLERDLSCMQDPPSQLNAYLAYVTRVEMSIRVHIGADLRFVIGWSAESEEALYGPPMPPANTPARLLEQMRNCDRVLRGDGNPESDRSGLYVFLLNQQWADTFAAIGARIFATPEDDNYVYRSRDIGTLQGRRLKPLRQGVRQFEREFGALAERELDEKRARDAESIVRSWMQQKIARLKRRPERSPDFYRNLRDDHRSATESLRQLAKLPLTGRIYYLDEQPVGYISGLPMGKDAFLVLNQKNFQLRGLSEVVFHRFAKSLMDQYAFLNGGSDAGIASLRFHKEHLAPCRMLKTYGAFLSRSLLDSGLMSGEHDGLPHTPH